LSQPWRAPGLGPPGQLIAGGAGARPDQCSEASCHSSGWKSRQQRSADTVVVISSDGKGDRPVESLEVKAPEKGEAFLTAYFKETAFADEPDDDDVIGSGSLLPEELDQFKRMAAAAGVKLDDQTRGE